MTKVFPSKFELELESVNVTCQERGCNKSFKHSSALRFHLVKVHNIIKTSSDLHLARKEKMIPIECQYHCPDEGCTYHYRDFSSKFFASLKLLRQHYKQVHCMRKFTCDACESKFGRKYDLERHQTRCGKRTFESCLNEHSVSSQDTTKDTEKSYNKSKAKRKLEPEITKIRQILPKPDLYITPFVPNMLWNMNNLVGKAFQPLNEINCSPLDGCLTAFERKKSITTQTNEDFMFRNISTQTLDDSSSQFKANRRSQGSQVLWSKRKQLTEHENSHTQTNLLTGQALPICGQDTLDTSSNYQEILTKMNDCQTQTLQELCNMQSYYLFNELNFLSPCLQDGYINNSIYPNHPSNIQFLNSSESPKILSSISQQTSYNELLLDIARSAGTQTSDLPYNEDNLQDLTLTLSNIETQTNDLLDLDFINNEYNDIQTQTSFFLGDILDHRNGLFSDIETQTYY